MSSQNNCWTDVAHCADERFRPWLSHPNNLGAALRLVCRQLILKLINEGIAEPFQDESELLNINTNSMCYIRTIILEGDGKPYTFGRVVVPKSVFETYKANFTELGTKLIGETLLYGHPHTIRRPFQFAAIHSEYALFNAVAEILPNQSQPLWARRSVFLINGKDPLLISEVFLPDIPRYDNLKINRGC